MPRPLHSLHSLSGCGREGTRQRPSQLLKLQVNETTRTLKLVNSSALPMVVPHVYTPHYIRAGCTDGAASYYGTTALTGESSVIKVRPGRAHLCHPNPNPNPNPNPRVSTSKGPTGAPMWIVSPPGKR